MKLKDYIEMYDPSEKDFKAEYLSDDEISRIMGMTAAKMIPARPRRRLKIKTALIAATIVLGTTTTVLALGPDLGLFDRALGSIAGQYAENINTVDEGSASAVRPDYTLNIYSTIFTDNDVYAIIAVKGKPVEPEDISINGRIARAANDQTVFGLTGKLRTIRPENSDAGTQYFLFSSTIAQTQISGNKELTIAAGGNFLKYNSLRDYDGDKLKLSVSINGTEDILVTKVSKVSSQALTFHPAPSINKGEHYSTVLLTPYGLKMTGRSDRSGEELKQAQELPWYDPDWYWFQPDVKITVTLTNGTEITMASSVSAQISGAGSNIGLLHDEKHPIGGSSGGDPVTGEFYNNIDFHGWELDLTAISFITIDGERFEVG